jgi:MerR HTH family regulatory protein
MKRKQDKGPDPLLRTGAAAEIAAVDPRTLLRWEKAGFVLPEHKSPGGQRWWRASAIRRLLQPGRPQGATGEPAEVTG